MFYFSLLLVVVFYLLVFNIQPSLYARSYLNKFFFFFFQSRQGKQHRLCLIMTKLLIKTRKRTAAFLAGRKWALLVRKTRIFHIYTHPKQRALLLSTQSQPGSCLTHCTILMPLSCPMSYHLTTFVLPVSWRKVTKCWLGISQCVIVAKGCFYIHSTPRSPFVKVKQESPFQNETLIKKQSSKEMTNFANIVL